MRSSGRSPGPYRGRVICVDASDIGVAQPDKVLFSGVSVTVTRGDRVAVVGVNGSGKTTLVRILAGQLQPDSGVVRFGRGLRVAVLEQDPVLPTGTVAEFLGGSWEVAAVATSLGVQPLLLHRTDELSGGQAKRVALAKTLVGDFDMIVLDEPTNHLDLEAIEWLEQRLTKSSAALVFITHDRHLMDRLTAPAKSGGGEGRIVELESGAAYQHRAEAGSSAYAVYLEGRQARHDQAAQDESTRKILAKKELEWLRRGAPARSTKPKARLRTAHEVVDGGPAEVGVRGNDLLLDAGTTRLGNQVIELIDVAQAYGDHRVLGGVNLLIEPGARLGVVGPNGTGKSTLLDIIAGRAQPSAGVVKRGATVVTGYADQQSSTLDPDAVVRELVAGPFRQPDWQDRVLLERFWFDSTAQFAPVRMLSGGERRRLLLVMVLATKPNLLVLDEPTNDLDLDTLRALRLPRRLARSARGGQPRQGVPRSHGRPRARHQRQRRGSPCCRRCQRLARRSHRSLGGENASLAVRLQARTDSGEAGGLGKARPGPERVHGRSPTSGDGTRNGESAEVGRPSARIDGQCNRSCATGCSRCGPRSGATRSRSSGTPMVGAVRAAVGMNRLVRRRMI